MTGIGKPVQLKRDGRDIYGIGVSDEFDLEARARDPRANIPRDLILRTDLLRDSEWSCINAVLQKITMHAGFPATDAGLAARCLCCGTQGRPRFCRVGGQARAGASR
jgi:hypothetical protein